MVAAPSLHLSGVRYRVEPYVPIAEMPHWLQARLSESHNGAESLSTIGVTLRRLRVSAPIKRLIAEGDQAGAYASRSEALFAVMRAMVMGGHSDSEISAVLLNPPHVIGEKVRKNGSAWLQGEIARARTKAHVSGQQPSAKPVTRQALAHPPLRLLTIDEVKSRPKPAWLIEPLVPQGALCIMFGPSGHGKSFLALEWALSIGSGTTSLGHAISPGPVLYVAAEGATGIQQRLITWEKARGCIASNVIFLDQPVNLLDEITTDAVLTTIDQAVLEQKLPAKPILIVVDTFARCFAGGDENLCKDASQAIDTLDKIRISTGACVLVVHHSGKNNKTERGSSALRGAANTMILVERKHKTITVSVDKQKDAEAAAPIFLKLAPHADSCVLESVPAKQGASKNAKTVLHLLSKATALSYTALKGSSGFSESTFNRVRRELEAMCAIKKSEQTNGYEITDAGKLLLLS